MENCYDNAFTTNKLTIGVLILWCGWGGWQLSNGAQVLFVSGAALALVRWL